MNDRPRKRLNRTEKAPSVLGAQIAAMTPEQLQQGVAYVARKLWLEHRARELARPIAAALCAGPPAGRPPWLHYCMVTLVGAAQILREIGPPLADLHACYRRIELDLQSQRWKQTLERLRAERALREAPAADPPPARTPPRKKPRPDTLEFLALERQGLNSKQIRSHFPHLNSDGWKKLLQRARKYRRRHRPSRAGLALAAPSQQPC